MRLLLIEDTPDLARSVLNHLRGQGHAVDHAACAGDGETALSVQEYACVLLDIGLPDRSGLSLLRDMRRAGNRTPVIIATAQDQISDRIAGLDAGADDYVVKPYDLAELTARIRANARRSQGQPDDRIDLGPLSVDRAAARVWRGADEVHLTAREWAVLDALLAAKGTIQSRQTLEDALYAFDDAVEGNAVEVYISRLRKKLGASVITTRRGLGYCLE